MAVFSPVSQIMNRNGKQRRRLRFRYHTVLERSGQKLRKDRNDVEVHLAAASAPYLKIQKPLGQINRDRPFGQIYRHTNSRDKRDQHFSPVAFHLEQQWPPIL